MYMRINTNRINGISLTQLVKSVDLPQAEYAKWRPETKFEVDVNWNSRSAGANFYQTAAG
jgi:hypothetical protein